MDSITILTYAIWLGAFVTLWLGVAYARLGVKLHARPASYYGLIIICLSFMLVLFPIVLTTNATAITATAVIISLFSITLIRIKQAHQIDAFLTTRGITVMRLLLMRY